MDYIHNNVGFVVLEPFLAILPIVLYIQGKRLYVQFLVEGLHEGSGVEERVVDDDDVRSLTQRILQHLHRLCVKVAVGKVEGIWRQTLEHIMVEMHDAGGEILVLVRLRI